MAFMYAGGAEAWLLYNPAKGGYSVKFRIEVTRPGSDFYPSGSACPGPCKGNSLVQSVLWDDAGRQIGCVILTDNQLRGNYMTDPQMLKNVGDGLVTWSMAGVVPLSAGCGVTFSDPNAPEYGKLHWRFSTAYTLVGPRESESMDALNYVSIGVAAVSIVLAAVCFVAAPCGAALGLVLPLVLGAGSIGLGITSQILGPDGAELLSRTMTAINGQAAVFGIPKLNQSFTCSPLDRGHDTWNLVEEFFYNRPPGKKGLGVTWPYDAGNYCLHVTADFVFFGLAGTLTDQVDTVRMGTVGITPDANDPPGHFYDAKPTDIHTTQWVASSDPGSVNGLYRFTVSGSWDFEALAEMDQRSNTITEYQNAADNGGCPNCGGLGVSPHTGGDLGQGIILDVYFDVWDKPCPPANVCINPEPCLLDTDICLEDDECPLDLCIKIEDCLLETKICIEADEVGQTNQLVASAAAKGLISDAQDLVDINVPVLFDLVPRIDCVYECPDGGAAQGEIDECLGLSACATSTSTDETTFFLLTSSPAETLRVLERVRVQGGSGTPVLVIHDASRTDWYAVGDAMSLEVLENGPDNLVGRALPPLLTIVERDLALP